MRLSRLLRSPAFFVALAPFILFAPVLFGNALFWGTPALQFHPWHVVAWETLKSGQLPLWNPLSGLGAPLIANYQSALFYPPNWIYFLFAAIGGETLMAWGMGLLAAFHLSLAGVGMVRLTRDLNLTPTAQTISGLAFALSGYLVARAHFLSINAAVAWLPWILWASYQLAVSEIPKSSDEIPPVSEKGGNLWDFKGIRGHSFIRLVIFIAMLLLAGHAQTAWYTLLLAGAWLIFWSLPSSSGRGARGEGISAFLRVLLFFGLGVLAGVALAAVQLLPTAELLSQSQRSSGAEYDFVMTYSFWPWRFLGYLAPGFFGSPVTGDYWGYGNFWEDAVYIGLLPFLLALRALFQGLLPSPHTSRIPHHALTRFLLVLLLLTFLLALGQNTPIFPFLYRYIPSFDLFQAPTRYTIWATFALALLAGIGVEFWQAPVGRKGRARVMRGVVISAAVVMAAFATRWIAPDIEPSLTRATMLAGFLGVGAGILGLYVPKRLEDSDHSGTSSTDQPASPFVLAVIGFVALDLLIAGWGLNPGVELDFYSQGATTPPEVLNLLGEGRLYLPDQDEYELTFNQYLQFGTFASDTVTLRGSLLPNLTLLENIPSANNFDPLIPGRYARWLETLETADPDQQNRMLSAMSVTVIERVDPAAPNGIRFDPVESLPRFRWTPCARPAGDEEMAWERLTTPQDARFEGMVNLEGFATQAEWVCGDEQGMDAQATIVTIREMPNEIRLRVNSETSGWVIVADTWYPGWVAEVDGEAREVLPVDYLFQAVPVPDGKHEVVMRYRPGSFYAGMGISIVGWLLWGWGGFQRRWVKKSKVAE